MSEASSFVPIGTAGITAPNKECSEVEVLIGPVSVIDTVERSAKNGALPCYVYESLGVRAKTVEDCG